MKIFRAISIPLLLALSGVVCADTVYLTDGTDVEGTVLSDDGATIVLRTKAGASRAFRRKDVETIEYTRKNSAAAPEAKAETAPAKAATAPAEASPLEAVTLLQVRSKVKSVLTQKMSSNEPVAVPPAGVFDVIEYASSAGKLAAYLTPAPKTPGKRPAIIWITGGDCNTIGDVWSPAARNNDQSARAFREAGIVMMFPSLRGGNKNPSFKEGFLGEVDDIVAAAGFLATKNYVDPERIYLGGHSTGGTMALLVAECSSRFRAVFSFGPVEKIVSYLPGDSPALPFDHNDRRELLLRSPGFWMHGIQSPTFILEGTGGNHSSLLALRAASKNPQVHILSIANADHFSTLAPSTEVIAQKILQDTGAQSKIELSEDELQAALRK